VSPRPDAGPDADRVDQDRDDQDRVVSRRVSHPTRAEPGDEEVYAAANPQPDGPVAAADDGAAAPATASASQAAAELDAEAESRPRRSE
jgi:hypothetical protein